MSPQAYSNHMRRRAAPMGGLESAALGMVAGALMSKLTGGGVSQQSLLSRIPGLGTTDPSQMNAGQVAQVAQYAQQNHPDLFGQAAAQVGQQQPGLLGALMGHAGMSQAAMGLASHFLSQRVRREKFEVRNLERRNAEPHLSLRFDIRGFGIRLPLRCLRRSPQGYSSPASPPPPPSRGRHRSSATPRTATAAGGCRWRSPVTAVPTRRDRRPALHRPHRRRPPSSASWPSRLGGYDAVLYELVGHRGEPATEEGVNDQQRRIAADMALENQGPHMNYDRPTFVHADLDLEDIQQQEVAAHGTFKGALGDGPGIGTATSPDDVAGLRFGLRRPAVAPRRSRSPTPASTPA